LVSHTHKVVGYELTWCFGERDVINMSVPKEVVRPQALFCSKSMHKPVISIVGQHYVCREASRKQPPHNYAKVVPS